jgi:phage baseplate assembly protein W
MSDLKVLTFVNNRPRKNAEIEMGINSNGTFSTGPTFVSDTDQAIQDLVKGLLTIQGTNRLAPNYGTNLSSLLHSRMLDNTNSMIVSQIRYLLGYLGSFNLDQSKAQQITDLVSLKSTKDVETIRLDMTVKTGGDATATVTIL